MRTPAIWLALHLPAPASWRPWMLGAALGRRPQKVAAALLCLGLALPLAAQTQPDPFHLIPASGGAGVPGEGTVTSVGLAVPADLFSVSSSPVTDAGTLTLTKATAAANTCYAGPVSGGAAAPTFRLLVAADIPATIDSDTTGNADTATVASGVAANSVNLGPDTVGGYAASASEGGAASSVAANSVALGPDTTGGYAASSTEGGAASSVAANSVALGPDTTGGYAGSATEAGAATSALAVTGFTGDRCARFDAGGNLVAASGDCSAGDTSGGITGTGTDDHFMRWNGTTAAQDSDLVLADAAGSSVSVSTTPGNALALAATAPTATTGASQAGRAASLTASAAVASTDTAGAAAGGSVTITGGAAARNTSGNADGGSIILTPGAGIGTGLAGRVQFGTWGNNQPTWTNAAGTTTIADFADVGSGNYALRLFLGDLRISTVGRFMGSGTNRFVLQGGGGMDVYAEGASGVSYQVGNLGGDFTNVSRGAMLYRSVELNTAGSGTPNAILCTESGRVFTNEGATAENHHNLPTASFGCGNFTFCVQDTDGIQVNAAAGDTIRIGASVSAAAGNVEATAIGSCVTLIAVNATEWMATAVVLTWTVN